MQTPFVSFYDVPVNRTRGTWVYGVASDVNLRPEYRPIFGSIQGVNLAGKAASYGIEAVGEREVVWVPDFRITNTAEEFVKVASQYGLTVTQYRDFIDSIEALSWVQRIRAEQETEEKL